MNLIFPKNLSSFQNSKNLEVYDWFQFPKFLKPSVKEFVVSFIFLEITENPSLSSITLGSK